MSQHKGQVITTDAYIGVTIFTLIFILSAFSYFNYSNQISGEFTKNRMQQRLLFISDLLMSYPGNFSDWQASCRLTIPGLGKFGKIEYNKLTQLGNVSCIPYQTLKNSLGTEGSEFYLEAKNVSGQTNTTAGIFPINESEKITLRRVGLINNVTYYFDFTLWRV